MYQSFLEGDLSKDELSNTDFNLVMEIKSELFQLGFDYEEFGNNCIVINGIPADIASENVKSLFEELIEQYKFNKNDIQITERERIIRALTKKVASNNLKRLTVIEMEELVNQLFGSKNPNWDVRCAKQKQISFYKILFTEHNS